MATAADIIAKCRDLLQDSDGTRWPDSELLRYISEGQRAIVRAKPDEHMKYGAFQLQGGEYGIRQDIREFFGNAYRLHNVIRNLGGDSLTPGAPIHYIDRNLLDRQQPSWTTLDKDNTVVHWMRDEASQTAFFICPPPTGQQWGVEVLYTEEPDDLDSTARPIQAHLYEAELVDYTLWRAYSKDDTFASQGSKAREHYQAFITGLGMRDITDRDWIARYEKERAR